jgi:hypothetical protein
MSNNELTKDDIALLQEYLQAMDLAYRHEPERLTVEQWDVIMDAIQETGDIPAEYSDRVGTRDISIADDKLVYSDSNTTGKGYYDIKWEQWAAECNALNDKYHDAIKKCLSIDLSKTDLPQDKISYQVTEIIRAVLRLLEVNKQTFSTIRQGAATNSLTKVRSTSSNTRLAIDGTAYTDTKDGFVVMFSNFKELGGLRTSTKKLMDALTIQFTETGAKSRHISIPLKDYMSKCGLKDRKEARKQVRADLDTLASMSLKFTDSSKGAPVSFERLNLFSRVKLSRDEVSATFTDDFYNLILGYPVMPYPTEMLKLNGRNNPNSYNLMRKITEHKNMNFDKPNADIISVSTLLKACPYIPTYEEVKNSNRNFTDRIIDPFERDMTACKNVFTWEYCHSNNTPLTDDELQGFNYDIFADLLVKINWISYPDTTARLEKKKSRKQGKKS